VSATPSQTVGPFFSLGLADRDLGGPARIEGRVFDGAGDPVPDAMVEVWQADETGSYRGDFGWGRSATDADGRYAFTTVKPGPVEGQASHLVVLVFARGLLKPLLTRLYFPDAGADPVLDALDDDERETLIARADGDSLKFDIRLQGDRQTTFFAL
jgi:protocatechuate 3,4-dioxygenase alpha subunit